MYKRQSLKRVATADIPQAKRAGRGLQVLRELKTKPHSVFTAEMCIRDSPQGGRKHPNQEMIQIDTKNILFIVGGAFDGIEDIVKQRLGEKIIGFGQNNKAIDDDSSYMQEIVAEDIQKFGLIPEFIGRLPVLAALEQLTVDDLVRILTEPRNALVKPVSYTHLRKENLFQIRKSLQPR